MLLHVSSSGSLASGSSRSSWCTMVRMTLLCAATGPSIVGKARRNYPHVQFDVADGWDVAKLGALAVGPDDVNAGWDSIFVDIGGLSGPDGFLEAVALLRSLKFAFPSLRALVIKVVFRV